MVASDRGTPLFIHDDKTKFTPEELVAQLLAKAKDFAEISHGNIFIFYVKHNIFLFCPETSN